MRISDWSSDVCSSDLAVVYRVDHAEQVPRARVVAKFGEGHRRPHRGVGVLAAVLAHAGHVAADVAGILRGLVERRVQQLHQAGVAPHQVLVERVHRLPRSEEHTSELQSLMRLSYAVFCLKKKKTKKT